MTGISSHVFKRLVIVIFKSGSLTLAGWTTTWVSEYNRVGEFKRDGLLMTVYDWDLFSCVQEVSSCKLSIR